MEATNNNTFQRIGHLLRMEWCIQRKSFILQTGLLILLFAGLKEFFFYTTYNQAYSHAYTTTYGLLSLIYFFYCFRLIQHRVNKSDTISYSLIPASAIEKYVSLIIITLFVGLVTYLANQVVYTIGFVLHPDRITDNSSFMFKFIEFSDGYIVLNPFALNLDEFTVHGGGDIIKAYIADNVSWYICLWMIASTIYGFGLYYFCAISFRKGIVAIMSYFGIHLFFLLITIIAIATTASNAAEIAYNLSAEESLQVMNFLAYAVISVIFVIGAVFLYFSYKNLKNRQLR